MKSKLLLLCVLVLAAIGIIFISDCIRQTKESQSQFYIKYHYTTEVTYQDIEINNSKMIYTYFPEEIAKEKCAEWIAQYPCWREKDLRRKEAILSEEEINDLIHLIKETDFMNLKSTYGGASQYQRYYPYKLFIKIGEKQKEVVYQSFLTASPMPEAFQKIRDRLFKLVNEKFK